MEQKSKNETGYPEGHLDAVQGLKACLSQTSYWEGRLDAIQDLKAHFIKRRANFRKTKGNNSKE